MTRTVRALLGEAVERFEQAGLSYGHGTTNALDEAAWLILHALGLPLDELNPHLDEPVDEGPWRAARALIAKRIRTRKPTAYLTNEAWLGKHKFYVDERVIVPRSFIAELIRHSREDGNPASAQAPASGWVPDGACPRAPLSGAGTTILDLCTGSGCLAILAALAWPRAKVDGADLSEDALEVAHRNVADYKLGRRVRLVKSDLFAALPGRKYDLIISNPPYVKASSMRKLPDEYRKEPTMALASGVDGLEHTRRILAQAKEHLNPDGVLVVEIGHNRAALERAYPKVPFAWPRVSAGAGYVFSIRREQLAPDRALSN